jgi:hypothetical protein
VQLSWARLMTDAAEVAAGPEETAGAIWRGGGVVHGGPVGNHGAGGADRDASGYPMVFFGSAD